MLELLGVHFFTGSQLWLHMCICGVYEDSVSFPDSRRPSRIFVVFRYNVMSIYIQLQLYRIFLVDFHFGISCDVSSSSSAKYVVYSARMLAAVYFQYVYYIIGISYDLLAAQIHIVTWVHRVSHSQSSDCVAGFIWQSSLCLFGCFGFACEVRVRRCVYTYTVYMSYVCWLH